MLDNTTVIINTLREVQTGEELTRIEIAENYVNSLKFMVNATINSNYNESLRTAEINLKKLLTNNN